MIGICDWGIGGVGVYLTLKKNISADIIYLSDTGYTPYGKVPEAELKQRLERVFQYLKNEGATYIIVACNAASTVVPADAPYITGMIEHAISLVIKHKPGEIGVAGGIRTIESGIYKQRLEEKGIKVYERKAQPLSARIEAGDIDSDGLKEDIKTIFEPIRHLDHILLACTHYPLITEQISLYAPVPVLLDPAEEVCDWIKQHWEIPPGTRQVTWTTTGNNEQMKEVLKKVYGIDTGTIKKIEL